MSAAERQAHEAYDSLAKTIRPAPPMNWERADEAEIDPHAYYVVQTNAGEWRDFDLVVLSGLMVQKKLEPSYVRGRPVWVAKITRPVSDTTTSYVIRATTEFEAARASARDIMDAAFRRYSPLRAEAVRANYDPKLTEALEVEIANALMSFWRKTD